jgi:NADH:ubiquinone oxidoreductase subunit C
LERAEALAAEGWRLADLTAIDLIGLPNDPEARRAWRGAGFAEVPEDAPAAEGGGHRFEVVVQLRHLGDRKVRTIHVPATGEPPAVPSVTPVWEAANFPEREAFDMFGIHFEGHPNLTRILMPDEWEGYPLRKDYGVGKVPIEFVPQPFMQIAGPGQAPSGDEAHIELDRLGQVVRSEPVVVEAPQESTRKGRPASGEGSR